MTGPDSMLEGARLSLADGLSRLRSAWSDGTDRSLARRLAGTAFLIRVGSAVVAYASQVLFARWMGSSEFGLYVYVWTWVLLIGGIVDLGLSSSAQRFIPEYTERGQLGLLRGFLFGGRWLALGLASAIAALGLAGIVLLRPWIDSPLALPLYLACFALPMYGLMHIQEGIARSYNWVNLASLPPYIIRQLVLIALMGASHALGFLVDAASATAMGVLSYWVITVGQLVMLNRRLAGKVPAGPRSYEVRRWFAVSLPIVMVEAFYLLLTYSDVLILKKFSTPHDVAVYYAAAKTMALVVFIHYAVAHTAAHKFTEFHVSGDRGRLAEFIAHIVRLTFWPSLAATALVLAFGMPLLWLFGRDFVDGYPLMFILAVGLLARASVGPVDRLLIMLGHYSVCAIVYAAAFTLNLALCVLLIPRLGPAGAAFGMASAMVLESVLMFLLTRRKLGYHVFIFGRTPQLRRQP
jgi:O-antigen/teichoic acid export membrane protein